MNREIEQCIANAPFLILQMSINCVRNVRTQNGVFYKRREKMEYFFGFLRSFESDETILQKRINK